MPFVLNDRVLETCTARGTGAVALQGTVPGYQTFLSGIGSGTNTFYYTLIDQAGTNWETGQGTYISEDNSITRNTVYASSNNNNPVNFTTGTQNIFVDLPGGQAVVNNGASYNINSATASTLQNIPTPNTLGAGNASAMKNRIINGSMVIDQRNAGASVTPTTDQQYTLDRYKARLSATSKFSVQQNAGSVTPPVGFTNYLGVTSLSAYSVGASDYFAIQQNIEGFNVADLGWGTANAKTVTLSFQVYSSLTGTFGGTLYSNASTQNYQFSYSIPVANTWTSISITIAGSTSGTWITNNGNGVQVAFSLGCGSTYTGGGAAWGSSFYFQPTGATSVVGTSGATFYITGVQLEVGSSATGFEYRQYGTELALCQRYYCVFPVGAGAAYPSAAGALASSIYQFPVAMRTAPTVTAGAVSAEINCAADTFTGGGVAITYFGGAYLIDQGGAAGNYYRYRIANAASAEL